MSNNKKKIGNQLSFFDLVKKQSVTHEVNAGFLNIHSKYCQILSKSIALSKYSRIEICLRMSQSLDLEITLNMLNSWTAESKEGHRMPGEFEPAFCWAVGNYELFEFKAQKSGRFLLPGSDALRVEIQRIEERIENLKREKEKRIFFLDEASKKFGGE